jgi:hypothetical protein
MFKSKSQREVSGMLLTFKSNHIGTLALLGLLVIFWGCTKAEETKPPTSKNESAQSAQKAAENASAPNAPAAPAGPATVVIAAADGEKAGTRVEITEVKRSSDNTLTLKFAMVNDGAEPLSFNYDYGDPQHSVKDFNSIGGVTLVDGTNKKKYFVGARHGKHLPVQPRFEGYSRQVARKCVGQVSCATG